MKRLTLLLTLTLTLVAAAPTPSNSPEKRNAASLCNIHWFHDRFCSRSVAPAHVPAEKRDVPGTVEVPISAVKTPLVAPVGARLPCWHLSLRHLCRNGEPVLSARAATAVPEGGGEEEERGATAEASPPTSERSLPNDENDAKKPLSLRSRGIRPAYPIGPLLPAWFGSAFPYRYTKSHHSNSVSTPVPTPKDDNSPSSPAVSRRDPETEKRGKCNCTKGTIKAAGEGCEEQCTGFKDGKGPDGLGWGNYGRKFLSWKGWRSKFNPFRNHRWDDEYVYEDS